MALAVAPERNSVIFLEFLQSNGGKANPIRS
jgi:hypothetical protein